jgi:hypothetical protein
VQHDDRDRENPGCVDRPARVGDGARGRLRATQLIAAVLLVAYAWWVVALAPFSGQATTAVVLGGAAAMAVGARQRRRARSPSARDMAGIATWAALAAAAGAWQLATYLQDPRADHPTVSSLANEVLDSHLARAVAFVVWIAAARGLARR